MSTEINAESPDGAADDTPKVRNLREFCVGGYIVMCRWKSIFMISRKEKLSDKSHF